MAYLCDQRGLLETQHASEWRPVASTYSWIPSRTLACHAGLYCSLDSFGETGISDSAMSLGSEICTGPHLFRIGM